MTVLLWLYLEISPKGLTFTREKLLFISCESHLDLLKYIVYNVCISFHLFLAFALQLSEKHRKFFYLFTSTKLDDFERSGAGRKMVSFQTELQNVTDMADISV